MRLFDAKVYRGGSSQDLIYRKPFEVSLENGKNKTLDVRFRTNPGGERKSTFCIEFGQESYPALLEHMAQNVPSEYSAILKTIAFALKNAPEVDEREPI